MKKLVSFLLISIFCGGFTFAQKKGTPKDSPILGKSLLDKQQENPKIATVSKREPVKVFFSDEEAEEAATKRRANGDGEVKAVYSLPQGYYYVGLSEIGSKFLDGYASIYGPAYYTEGAYWGNASQNAMIYQWESFNPAYRLGISEDYAINTSEEVLEVLSCPHPDYPIHAYGYPAPILSAYSGSNVDYYWFGLESHSNPKLVEEGETINASFVYLGGKPSAGFNDKAIYFGITNIDHYNFQLFTSEYISEEEVKYIYGSNYGSGPQNAEGDFIRFDACGELFTKPLHPYVLDAVRLACGRFIVEKDTELQIIIHRCENGVPVDTIARSTWIAETDYFHNHITDGLAYFQFNNLEEKVGEGEYKSANWIIISDEILVEFTGYNDSPYNLIAVVDQEGASWDGKSTAYLYRSMCDVEGNIKEGAWRLASDLISGNQPSSIAIMLDVTYSYLVPKYGTEAKVEFPLEGGSQIVEVDSYYMPAEFEYDENGSIVRDEDGAPIVKEIVDGVVMFTNVPDWLMIEIDGMDMTPNFEHVRLKFTVEPSATPKWGEPIVYTLGAEQKFIVTQGDVTSVEENRVNEVNVTRAGDIFNLIYSDEFSSVAVYNISGQKVYETTLQEGGLTTISANGLEKGIYIFRFAGNKTESVKVLN